MPNRIYIYTALACSWGFAIVTCGTLWVTPGQHMQIDEIKTVNRWDAIDERVERIDAELLEIEQRLDALLRQ